jgi:hypothetical protein
MVGEALKHKIILNSYANQYVESSTKEQQWIKSESICEFLNTFEEATKAISAYRKSTSCMFLALIISIQHALDDPSWQTNVVLEKLALQIGIPSELYVAYCSSNLS